MPHQLDVTSRLAMVSIVAVLLGCSSANPLSGSVTYDGQPVQNGVITFTPADGKGPSAGGAINAGRYAIEDVPPGEKIVQISAFNEVPLVRTTDELARQAESAAGRRPPPTKLIPENAVGNNARVAITAGQDTLDFNLTPPAS